MKDDQKMKHKNINNKQRIKNNPIKCPQQSVGLDAAGRSKSCNGEILLEGSLYTILDEKQKRNLKNFDQRFCHLDRGRGSSRFTVC